MIPANLSIFRQDYAPRSTRVVQTPDGTASVYSALAVGRIVGQARSIPALACEEIGTEDRWHVVGLYVASRYVESVAVLGATSPEQAADWASRQVLAYLSGGQNFSYCTSDAVASSEALQAVLDSAATGVVFLPIRQKDINLFEGRITDNPVVWDNDALQSHTAAELIHELAKHDRDGQMMDAMCKDDLPKVVSQYDGIFELFDALIVDYNRLGLMQDRLFAAMHKANVGSVKPLTVTPTKPFKRNGVTNVAVLFEMDDGQTVTIIFHSPDATPAKLGPKDTLTSWKWLLNKRDVTVAVAPDNGENVQLPALARRILLLVEKNSARFKRTNVKKSEQMQDLADTTSRVEQKTAALDGLNAEIEGLQKQIDAGGSASVTYESAFDPLRKYYYVRKVDAQGKTTMSSGYKTQEEADAEVERLKTPGASQFPAAPAAETAPTAETGSIPVRVERDVISAVQSLQASAKSLDQVIRVRGHGFNLEEALKEMQPKIDSNMATLQKYRDAAAGNGASDALESLVSANGGVPDFAQYQQAPEEGIVTPESVPVILTGKEFGDFPDTPEGKRALRDSAIAKLSNLRDEMDADQSKGISCPILGEMVYIRGRGIREVKSFSANPMKLKLIYGIRELIGNAYEKDWEPNYKRDKKPRIEGYFTLKSKAVLDGKEMIVDVLIEKDDQGHFHYDLLLDRQIAKEALVSASHGADGDPTPKAGDRLDTDVATFDSAGQETVKYVINLFIEGEAPEVIEEEAEPPKKNRALDQKIKLVADSVEKVRKQDVQRLIESIEGKTSTQRNEARKEIADHLKASRPDLSEEVDAVLFDLQEDIWVDSGDIARFGQVEITSHGNENIYFTKDGQKYYSKVLNNESYPVGPFDMGAYPDGVQVVAEAPAAPASDPDTDLLNAIISGTTSAADVDMDALIAIAEKYDGKPEMEGLVNQALEVVTQYELDAAKAIG